VVAEHPDEQVAELLGQIRVALAIHAPADVGDGHRSLLPQRRVLARSALTVGRVAYSVNRRVGRIILERPLTIEASAGDSSD
jgi:hypothetical protein